MSNELNFCFRYIVNKAVRKRPLILFSILLGVALSVQAQSFIESYAFHPVTGDVADHVIATDSAIFFHNARVVDDTITYAQGGLVRLSTNGGLIWSNEWVFPFGNVGTSFANGILSVNDTVYTTGNYRDSDTGIFSPAIVANSIQTGEFRAIRFPYNHRASIQDIFYNDDSTFTTVSEDRVSSEFQFFVIVDKLDRNGQSTSSFEYLTEFAVVSSTNSARDANKNIYVAHIGCLGPDATCYPFQGWLSKINADGSFGWSRSYGYTANRQGVRPNVAVLNDTTIAYSWTRDTNDITIQESPPIIYYLDTLGNERDSFAFHGGRRTLQKLITCANGDLVGVGYASTDIGYTGWMFRLDGNANLVWERYVQDHRQTISTETDLESVTEAADGSIIAAGDIFHYGLPRDGGSRLRAWIVKLDADGCYEPGCTSDTIYLEFPTAIIEPDFASENDITVYPNPVTDVLSWSVTDLPVFRNLTDYHITNAAGRVVSHGPLRLNERAVNVRGLPKGVYFLNLVKDGKRRGVKRFVKM